jgi:threonine dehydrogenase-like Zn-dependent dehydrogenase
VPAEPTPPYGAYAAIAGTFVGGLAAAGALARALDRNPHEHSALDLVTLALATFKAARTISRDPVASFVREPFVEGHAGSGHEHAVETGGFQQALGELVTCTRCAGTWVAAGLGATQIVAPRFGRILTWTLGAAGVNDFLQAGFAALAHASDAPERRAES